MACSNNPYPHEGTSGKVFYTAFSSSPKNLDPQHTYTMADLAYLRLIYEPLVDYHYLDAKKLIPALAESVPEEKITEEKGEVKEVRYSFKLREGVHFIDDPCFTNGKGRELKAEDFHYVFKRASDPFVACPIASQLVSIKGFKEYSEKVKQMREEKIKELEKATGETFDPEKHYINSKDLYDACGDFPGIEVTGEYSFDMVMTERYPQILYWLAMRFICAIPYEAVDYYNPTVEMTSYVPMRFDMHPVGTGCYRILWEEFRKAQKVIMVKNETWWGNKIAAPTTRFPEEPYSKEDVEKGYWTPERAGTPIAQFDRIECFKEVENIPQFGKFLQGYYDTNQLPPEKMGEAISNQSLSPKMKNLGVELNKSPQLAIKYIGFNMTSDILGAPKKFEDPELESNREVQLEKNKKLRQALTLAIDSKEFIRIHLQGMGMDAQSPLPPGLFGYDEDYLNPHCYKDEQSIEKARKLLEEAGYPNGIDSKTGKPLELEFSYSTRNPTDDVKMEFYIKCWGRLGVKVVADGNEYNIFQDKVRDNQFQMFIWGWHADYPDPENFFFLLGSDTAPDPNYTQYSSPDFDFYFGKLKMLTNEQSATWKDDKTQQEITMSRMELLRKCKDILAEDCPWIPLYHDVYFELHHGWMKNVKSHPLISYPFHMYDIDSEKRTKSRELWNQPILWPAFVLFGLVIFIIIPIYKTYMKERN